MEKSNGKLSLGIDIGGTNTAIGLVAADGTVVRKESIETARHGDAAAYAKEVATVIRRVAGEDLKNLVGIGIGAPNANYYTGKIEYAPNLSFKGIVPLVDLLKAELPEVAKIQITNDANAAAMGEMVYGKAQGMKDFVMITLGTGLGSGIIVNGKLVYGHDGFAGEVGHAMLIRGGRRCGCGVRGHVEAYCSATGIKRTAFELLAETNATDSALANKSFNELTAKDICIAANQGDEIAKQVFERTGEWLAQALADTIHFTSPEAIFLFGGPVAAGDLLFNPLMAHLDEYLLPVFRGKVKVMASGLKPGDAAIVGAAALVM